MNHGRGPTCQGVDSFSAVLLLPCEIPSHRLDEPKYIYYKWNILLQDRPTSYRKTRLT